MNMNPAAFPPDTDAAAVLGLARWAEDPFDDSYAWVGYESAYPSVLPAVQPITGPEASDAGRSRGRSTGP
jgi:hypothetical protein